jgi:pyruvate kinase
VIGVPGAERRTKIVCTVGPASASAAQLEALVEHGMDVARLNFSHGEHAEHGAVVSRLRALAHQRNVPLAILQDLAGPKVRLGTFAEGSVELEPGRPFTLTTRPVEGTVERVSVSYAGLPGEVRVGDVLLLADGAVQLRVQHVRADEVRTEVVVGGHLASRKGVNVPSGLPGLPILGARDLDDLRFGLEQGVDFVGLSFVRTADDVRAARSHIAQLGGRVPVIAKIETQAALDNIDAILEAADGIMIARGDLSLATPFTRVPVVQKRLIAQACRRAKPVITATQMLFSMVSAPLPTRAEVADVANAILDGSDAVMLSEETAVGLHPARAVEVMAAIARETERDGLPDRTSPETSSEPAPSEEEAVVQAACQLAGRRRSDLILTVARTGTTARLAAKYRPAQPIVALTGHPETYRRLALVRGVVPVFLSSPEPADAESPEVARAVARERGWQGLRVVFVSRALLWTGAL